MVDPVAERPLSPSDRFRLGLFVAVQLAGIVFMQLLWRGRFDLFGLFGRVLIPILGVAILKTAMWTVYLTPLGLLAIGSVLLNGRPSIRITATLCGIIAFYLCAFKDGPMLDHLTYLSAVFLSALAISWLVRCAGFQIHRPEPALLVQPPQPTQFTIQQALLATAGVALVVAMPVWIQDIHTSSHRIGASIWGLPGYYAWIVIAAACPVVALWSALGTRPLLTRIVIGAAALVLLGLAWQLDQEFAHPSSPCLPSAKQVHNQRGRCLVGSVVSCSTLRPIRRAISEQRIDTNHSAESPAATTHNRETTERVHSVRHGDENGGTGTHYRRTTSPAKPSFKLNLTSGTNQQQPKHTGRL